MYKCPNCGGNIKFSPNSGKILCPWCGISIFPKTNEKAKEIKENGEGVADEHSYTEGTVCTCSQCGGELFTEEDTGITFCPYCGSQNMISSKIKLENPQYIIPFMISEEQCKQIYLKKIKKNIFIKSEFRKPETIDKFRGIYMPFWKYSGKASYTNENWSGEKTEMGFSTSTINEYFYDVSAEGDFDNFFCDATASFPDDISSEIQPYNMDYMVPFNSDMTAGFYTDTGNIPKNVYDGIFQDAVEMKFCEHTCNEIQKSKTNPTPGYGGVVIDEKSKKIDRCYLPVWFMSVKNKNGKMSYAVINGQTGKMYTDMPLSVPKLLLLSLAFAVPIFLLLFLMPTVMTPIVLLCIIMAMLIVSLFPALNAADEEYMHERGFDNWGKIYTESNGKMKPVYSEKNRCVKSHGEWPRILSTLITSLGIVVGILIFFIAYNIIIALATVIGCSVIGRIILAFKVKQKHDFTADAPGQVRLLRTLPVIICIITGLLVIIINPIEDEYYYAASLAGAVGLLVQTIGIIKRKNATTTRKPMQLNKRVDK